jgi:cardiolipin synthase
MLEYIQSHLVLVTTIAVALFEILGVVSAANALLTARTSQGAIAWAVSLVALPYIALPLYWIFGRNRFHGYVDARRVGDREIHHVARALQEHRPRFEAKLPEGADDLRALVGLAKMPFTRPNRAELLVDGEATFDAIFRGIEAAKEYVLVEFFIIRDDDLGRKLQARLLEKAKEGVRVHVLYDEIGSHTLPRAYAQELRAGGVDIRRFGTTRGRWNRFQLNFRNHRKIVVVDGRVAFVGGLNVGDEYMGRDPRFGHWRDTHARFEGPAVTCVQLAFMEDWHWATHEVPELLWEPQAAEGSDQSVLVLPSGPADDLETCNLFFLLAIHSARRRLWIVSPYFVPDGDILAALQLAALRGVDVRILLPEKPDHLMVYLASFGYIAQLDMPGIRFYRYQPGFLHQKVILVDESVATVGTANADNRSFRLNFEITMVVADGKFAAEVERMLEADFARARLATAEDYHRRGYLFKLGVKLARLFSPIL